MLPERLLLCKSIPSSVPWNPPSRFAPREVADLLGSIVTVGGWEGDSGIATIERE